MRTKGFGKGETFQGFGLFKIFPVLCLERKEKKTRTDLYLYIVLSRSINHKQESGINTIVCTHWLCFFSKLFRVSEYWCSFVPSAGRYFPFISKNSPKIKATEIHESSFLWAANKKAAARKILLWFGTERHILWFIYHGADQSYSSSKTKTSGVSRERRFFSIWPHTPTLRKTVFIGVLLVCEFWSSGGKIRGIACGKRFVPSLLRPCLAYKIWRKPETRGNGTTARKSARNFPSTPEKLKMKPICRLAETKTFTRNFDTYTQRKKSN